MNLNFIGCGHEPLRFTGYRFGNVAKHCHLGRRYRLYQICEIAARRSSWLAPAMKSVPMTDPLPASSRRLHLALCLLALVLGCRTRSDYRRWADCEVAEIIQQRECDPLWDVPERSVLPDPRSRMADQNGPDCGALPPDDPAAHSFMHCADGRAGWPHWHYRGDLPIIEFSDWESYLATDDEGVVVLTREKVIELALLHSRDYQSQFEQLYFSALSLTLNRFDFDHQWFGRSSTLSNIRGNGPPLGSEALAITNGFGFTKNLTTGGQWIANLANSFVWEFAGDDISMASTGVLFSLAQPLLRGAFREVRMEPLTQAERNVLYTLRDFARFRRAFYVDTIGANGYLGLLAVSQAIKNQRNNLEALERNLEEHEKLLQAGLVAPIQVDQIFQQYQQGRLNLLSAEQSLEAALDQFKLQLGLPPQLQVRLDDDALAPFELSSDELDQLTDDNEALRLSLLQFDKQPPAEVIKKGLTIVKSRLGLLKKMHAEIEKEWETWDQRLEDRKEPTDENSQETLERERKLSARLKQVLDDVMQGIEEDGPRIERAMQRLESGQPQESRKSDRNSDDDIESEPDDGENGNSGGEDSARLSIPQLSRSQLIERIQDRIERRQSTGIHQIGFDQDSVLLVQQTVESIGLAEQDTTTKDAQPSPEASDESDRNEATFELDSPAAATAENSADMEEINQLLELDDETDEYDENDGPLDDEASDTSTDRYDNLLGNAEDKTDEDERERKARIAKETPWEALQELTGREFRKHVSELFVVQNQIRVFLIQVNDLEMDSDVAVARAMQNRLDLRNQQAVVVDTFRQVEVAADQLEADLGIRLEAELGTDPGRANPVRFDASAHRYRAGFEFDSPLTRLQERNVYRTAQIRHQQARRDFMALKDQIAAQVRADIRALKFNRFRFEIARQQLIVAARQVDEAQLNLGNATGPNSSSTRDLLFALQGLLDSKNNLIQSWVNYETSRMNLFRDLEQMTISSDGNWLNEYDDSSAQSDVFTDLEENSGPSAPSTDESPPGNLDTESFDNVDTGGNVEPIPLPSGSS